MNLSRCSKDINECKVQKDPCEANADCENTVGSHECPCKPGFARKEPKESCTANCMDCCRQSHPNYKDKKYPKTIEFQHEKIFLI